MIPISVVIITKNEEHIIGQTIRAVQNITDDIVIVDSGSTDSTTDIAKAFGCKLIETGWDGFGPNKNKGINAARYDWILSIDADEIPNEELLKSLEQVNLEDTFLVYKLNFKTFLGKKLIRFGEWSNETHNRFFNRKHVHWNDAAVHEELVFKDEVQVKNLPGCIMHYSMKDMADFSTKMTNYALMNAFRLQIKGKKANWVKRNFSHRFSFLVNYYFKFGFLDGIEGYWIARISSQYTFLKYARLYELNRQQNK